MGDSAASKQKKEKSEKISKSKFNEKNK